MYLFPERADRSGRRLIIAALIASFVVHLALVLAWGLLGQLAPVVAKLLPRPTPTPEIVALSDAITIEKRTVPREAHRAVRPVPPRPRRLLAQLAAPPLAVPTLAPVPTAAPTSRPTSEPTAAATYRPLPGTVHHRRAAPAPLPKPRELPTQAPPPPANGFSPQQMAALDAQFSKTIAQAQHALSNVPPQRRPPARARDQLRYEAIMAGTPEMFFAAFQGDCVPIEGPEIRGAIRFYYIRCMIRYSDGYFENVSYPWVYRFPRQMDPFDERVDPNHDMRFSPQGPSPGFVLPPHFALSRAICTFYRAQCENIIARERANGNQPAPDRP